MLQEKTIYKDRNELIKEICIDLNDLTKCKLDIDCNFIYSISEDFQYYNIYNKNKYNKENHLDLNLKLYFDDLKDKFTYAYIQWFAVNPKRVGIGSNIIKNITSILNEVINIDIIVIHPKDKEVKSFWMKNDFTEENKKLLSQRKIKLNTMRVLVKVIN